VNPAPAVVVHGAPDVAVACAPGRPLVLLSARGAALYGGPGWWRAVVASAPPGLVVQDMLDCADAQGRAHQALTAGCRTIIVELEDGPILAALQDIAAGMGATILRARPPALDLAMPGAARHLRTWLAG
jgi:hypothetical protein